MLREMNIFLKTNITFFKNGVDLRKNQVESKFHVWNVIAIFARLIPEIFLEGTQRGGGGGGSQQHKIGFFWPIEQHTRPKFVT